MAAKQPSKVPVKNKDKGNKFSAVLLAKKLKERKAFRKKLLSQI